MVTVFKYYLIIINVVSLVFYILDKFFSKIHSRRISENTLLNLSILGGCYGSILGMLLVNHKTKKIRFKVINTVSFIIYTLLIYYFYKYF